MNLDAASVAFIAYGLTAAFVSNWRRTSLWRGAVLIIFSLMFLALIAKSVWTLMPLIGFLALGYIGLILIRYGVHRWATLSILVVILTYAWLKRYTFLPDDIFLRQPYFTLGLSYILFRVLHLLIESRDRAETGNIGPVGYLLYNLNFTTFVSGPIQRYEEFAADQFAAEPVELGAGTIGMQLERIVRGFFKVNVLAVVFDTIHVDTLAELAQPVPMQVKLTAAFALAVAYPLFLYCNFSGYIDIVIALARLCRVRLPENFDRPFSARSVIEFWTRWHITLSTWLKTYVYNPLLITLMRRIPSAGAQPYLGVFSFFVTFFLIGIWHGRTSEFIMFGFLDGAGISLNKFWQISLTNALGRARYSSLGKNPLYAGLSRGLNFTWFALTLFWFWGAWEELSTVYHSLSALNWLCVWISLWLIASLVLAMWEWLRQRLLAKRQGHPEPMVMNLLARVAYATTLTAISLVTITLLNQPTPPIVYKAF